MRKVILTFFTFLLLLFTFTTSVLAAPTASLTTSKDRRFAYVSFSGLKNVSRVAYTLTYNTNGRTTGVEGGLKPGKYSTRASRRQILGTCSTRFCTYHKNPTNLNLDVTFYYRSGGSTTVTKSLP